MKNMLFNKAVMLWIVLFLTALLGGTQESKLAFPMVASAEVPLYPWGARMSNVEGVVQVRINTDGHRVIRTNVVDGSNPMLSNAAKENVLTWRFTVHKPTVFTVTYRYKLVTDLDPVQNNPRVILKLPTEVEVDAQRWPGTVDMPPELKPKK